jgi:polysaccharide pyruvyl transferase WcaK-like protein
MPTVLAAVGGAGTVERVTRLKKAADLAGFISTVDLVMAHRLHACIAAYSYEVPNVGFTWDQKMQSFFDSVGRSRYLCAAVSMSAADVVSLAEEALLNGIDAEERRLVIAETQADIAGLLRNLASA